MSPSVVAKVEFLSWQKLYEVEKPFVSFVEPPPDAEDKRRTNLHFENHSLIIQNARPYKDSYTLDSNGFIFRDVSSSLAQFHDFSDKRVVEAVFLPMVEEFIKQNVEGADHVKFFDRRIRKNMTSYQEDTIDLSDLSLWLLPVTQAHVDQSRSAVLNRILRQFPDEADRLLQGRVRVINFWKPLNHTVEDRPLAVCDGSTVDTADLIETDHVRRHYTGSTLFAMYNPAQRWQYFESQQPHEALILKMFDSEEHDANLCPHVSFEHPSPAPAVPPRESVEVRALVFTTLAEEIK